MTVSQVAVTVETAQRLQDPRRHGLHMMVVAAGPSTGLLLRSSQQEEEVEHDILSTFWKFPRLTCNDCTEVA